MRHSKDVSKKFTRGCAQQYSISDDSIDHGDGAGITSNWIYMF